MNNTELEQQILEIINKDNFFDMVLAAKDFEPEYKKSDFFKETKMPLNEVIKNTRLHYALQLRDLSKAIQRIINNLDLSSFDALLNQIETMFTHENEEIQESLEVFKDLKN